MGGGLISLQVVVPVVPWLSHSPLVLRFTGSNPAEVDGISQCVNNLSKASFGRKVKPLVSVVNLRHVKET